MLYPFPDELFWHAEDVGEWDGEGVPAWRENPDAPGRLEEKKIGIFNYAD